MKSASIPSITTERIRLRDVENIVREGVRENLRIAAGLPKTALVAQSDQYHMQEQLEVAALAGELTVYLHPRLWERRKGEIEPFTEFNALDDIDWWRIEVTPRDLDKWIDNNVPQIPFRFCGASPFATPSQRRAYARALVDKHGGNKAAVGREMGISRERVRQLLNDQKDESARTTRKKEHSKWSKL